ncbi:MAG: Gfo/Idh/MocA family oxidoreductase [Pseudomonadota bacterium]
MLRFGTLGAAAITPRALIYPCLDEPQASISTIAARDRHRAEAFAEQHRIRHVVEDYQAVIDSDRVDAVYIPLHITAHHEWTLKALAAGKHVLCEKSLAANASEAAEMAAAAGAADRVLMDAFHYRYHPVFLRAREILESGELGEISTIDAAFHIPVKDPDNIRMRYETGGGVTMDIGCYPISWVRHLTDLEPAQVSATAELGPPKVDLKLESDMLFPGGIRATTSGDMRPTTTFKAEFTVTGSRGSLRVLNPLTPQSGHRIELVVDGETHLETRDRRPTYGYQLDAFLAAVNEGATLATDGADGAKQMAVIDRCYEAAGLPPRGLPQ